MTIGPPEELGGGACPLALGGERRSGATLMACRGLLTVGVAVVGGWRDNNSSKVNTPSWIINLPGVIISEET